MNKKRSPVGVNALLQGKDVRRLEREGKTFFAVIDAVAVLTGSRHPAEEWESLKKREPQLAKVVQMIDLPAGEGQAVATEVVDLAGLLRLIQSVPSPRAEKLKAWLASNAVERLQEAENPELAVLRTRRLYESRGYSRRWVDKRLRGVSARHELTGEWYKRGAKESDQFRALTNTIMEGGFGMDVEGYRRHKGLFKTGENLRDHMSDLELALTALGETAAVALHKDRDSHDFDALLADARDAGEIVAQTRAEIEGRLGHGVIEAANGRGWWAGRRRVLPAASTATAPSEGTAAGEPVNTPDAPAVESSKGAEAPAPATETAA